MTKISCIVCGNTKDAKRADAKFCSGACRMRHKRGVTDKPLRRVTDKSVTDISTCPKCHGKMEVSTGDEGTSCYVCRSCDPISNAEAMDTMKLPRFETPCAEGGIKHGGPGCTHGTFRNAPMAKDQPKGILMSSGAPGPFDQGTKTIDEMEGKPAYTRKRVEIVTERYVRAHADGCPCWTCKGVPSKQTK